METTLMNEQEEKLAKFQNLLLMAFADGKLAEVEKDRLTQYIDRFGLTPDQCFAILQNQAELNFIIPKDAEKARQDLKELIGMMLADTQISEFEYQSCLKYAKQAGISRQDVDEMIKSVKS